MRTGIGYDIHRLVPTIQKTAIPIGGVSIGCHYQIRAHSDGDVLLHALTDAILGALALGDIGQYFPDSDLANYQRNSSDFVAFAMKKALGLGWVLNQMDCVLILEEPKLAPYVDTIRRTLANLLQVDLSSISLKAKTSEGLGETGERRAIACHAVVTLKEK